MKRRDFVKNTALASGMMMVPSFVKAFDDLLLSNQGYKRLVIIHLDGGNDGLNTVIPFRNDIYYRKRPTLGIRGNKILKIHNEIGLHASLESLRPLYDNGELSILNNVGYPNPVRSHFRSADIWQTASASNEYLKTGWVGRYLDVFGEHPYNAIEVDDSLSFALKGQGMNGIATKDAVRLYNTSQKPYFKKIISHYTDDHLSEHNLGYLYKTLIEAESSAAYIYEKNKLGRNSVEYPKGNFADQLKTMAKFINARLKTKIYYTSLSGFDTHANQMGRQAKLLEKYAEGVSSFVKDLKSQGTFDDTLILTFSEFGRRVEQNAANGTDHGAANNLFVIGKNLKKPGFYNELGSLRNLDTNGDLKYEIDFRSVYATILNTWLGVDDTKILNHNFEKLHFI